MNNQTRNFGKIADHPFEHRANGGTELKSRCDLGGEVIINKPDGITEEKFVKDIAEIFVFHSQWILPDLNGFSGYQSIKVIIARKMIRSN